MKKIIQSFLAVICIIGITTGCSGQSGKSLSGEYTIDKFVELIKPAEEARKSAGEYATEEEVQNVSSEAYDKALREIGFKGGEEIIINGKYN